MLRTVMPATALVAALTLLAPGCGGTLEGKYNRGQLTTSTSGPQGVVPGAPTSTTTTLGTPPTSGNAAGRSVGVGRRVPG